MCVRERERHGVCVIEILFLSLSLPCLLSRSSPAGQQEFGKERPQPCCLLLSCLSVKLLWHQRICLRTEIFYLTPTDQPVGLKIHMSRLTLFKQATSLFSFLSLSLFFLFCPSHYFSFTDRLGRNGHQLVSLTVYPPRCQFLQNNFSSLWYLLISCGSTCYVVKWLQQWLGK